MQKNNYLENIFTKTSILFNTNTSTCENIFNSQFEFARLRLDSIDVQNCSKRKFDSTKKNFNFSKLFKLYASWNQKIRIDNNKFKKKENELKRSK